MRLLYALLLGLYSPAFRQRYAAEMLRAFDDRRRAARAEGLSSVMRFHVGAVLDVLSNAAAERAARRGSLLTSLAHDVRLAVRMLWRRPGLTAFSALTLAVGIGSLTAVAGLVDAVLIQPLPYPRPSEIVAVQGRFEGDISGLSYEDLRDLAAQSRTLTSVSGFFAQSVNLTGVPEPDRLRGGFVMSGFFGVVSTPPALGRVFGAESDEPNTERAAVLMHGAWQRRFGGRSDIVGQQLQLNNASFTVVGVMPESFTFPIDDVEVLLPLWTVPVQLSRDNHTFFAVARLAPGVTLADARGESEAIGNALARVYPDANGGRGIALEPFHQVLVADEVKYLRLLGVMACLMLLAACANVAGLQIGSAAGRRREIAVRAALGAGRLRIARQLVVESLARAALGAVLGVMGAHAALRFLVANAPSNVHGLADARISTVGLACAAIAAVLAGAVAGLAPALHWMRREAPVSAMAGGRSAGDRSTSRLRHAVVVCQIALAAFLLVAAGLVTRSFSKLASVDAGFDASGLLTLEYRLPRNKYPSMEAQRQFHEAVLEHVRAVPGVMSVAAVRALPFSGNGSSVEYAVTRDGEPRRAQMNAISEDYFDTLRIPLAAGRAFLSSDRDEPVVIISRTVATREWPSQNPIGRHLYFENPALRATVIGVVEDVRHFELADANAASIYIPQRQAPGVFNSLAVRTAGDPMALAASVRRAVWAVDSDQPVWKVRTLESMVTSSLSVTRFLLQLVTFFGVSAGLLAGIGLYGLASGAVVQRTQEIGIRVAVGASRTSVIGMILNSGLRLAVAGTVIGLAGSLAAGRLAQGLLYEITAHDPLTFGAVAVLLLATTAAACVVPALRAVRVNPVDALRRT